jgi:hypothetical protein
MKEDGRKYGIKEGRKRRMDGKEGWTEGRKSG